MMARLRSWMIGGVVGGILASALAHAGAWAGLSYALGRYGSPAVVAELDLSMAAMLPPNPGGGRAARPAAAWTVPKHRPLPPSPVAQAPQLTDQADPLLCPEPCATSTIGIGGGGNGQSQGLYIPASQAARQPRWIANFITSSDYPQIARQKGKDGRVVLSVLIDAHGLVRDVRLLQGAYEELNELALRKVRQAVFSPAYDADGHPMACNVKLPIRFVLEEK